MNEWRFAGLDIPWPSLPCVRIQWPTMLTQDFFSSVICSDLPHWETEQDKVINASLNGLDLNSDASIPCGAVGMDHNTDSFSSVGGFFSHQNRRFSCRKMDYGVCRYDIVKTLFSPYVHWFFSHYQTFLLLPSSNCGWNSRDNRKCPQFLSYYCVRYQRTLKSTGKQNNVSASTQI